MKKRINNKSNNKKYKSKIKLSIIIPSFLVVIVFIIGILMLFFGIKGIYQLNKNTQGFITTTAYYKYYEIYNSNKDRKTYKLNYIYIIDGAEYEISTDYETNYIPDLNSTRKIKYNPNSPSKSVLVGTNSHKVLIYGGIFFILGSILFILYGLKMLGIFAKIKFDIIGIYIGIAFLIIGIGIILLQIQENISLLEIIKIMKLWFLIPIMFIFVGIYQIINCLNFKKAIKL